MKNKGAKQKLKRKGAASAFGCDLTEYLESSGQDGKVPSPPSLRPPKEMVTLDPGAQILPAWSGGSTVLCLMYGPCFRVRQTGFSS